MSEYKNILVALRKITRAIDLNSRKLVRVTGLTAPQLLVMRAIADEGCSKPSLIAREVQLSQATVTSIVDRLERSGFVTRSRSSRDRRSVEISLTDAGAAKLHGAPELLQAGFFREFNQLQDWERSLLVSSLQRIATMMDADDLEAAPILDVGELARSDTVDKGEASTGDEP